MTHLILGVPLKIVGCRPTIFQQLPSEVKFEAEVDLEAALQPPDQGYWYFLICSRYFGSQY